jgi:hypothetical protein
MTPIQISDFDSEGVTLTPASAPDFDERAQAILGGNASSRVLELKPYLAIVRNSNPRTVVAYTVSWTATRRNDSSEVHHTQFKFPDAVAGTSNGLAVLQGREIRTGEERLVGMGFEVWPPEYVDSYGEFGRQAATGLGEVKQLGIALDAAIFDDGVLLGRDEARLVENFIEFVHEKQSLYRDIVTGLENGDVKEDVFAPLREALARASGHQVPLLGYRRQAAAEVLSFHNRVVLEVFRRTLRREPFAIRRLSGTSD